MNEERQEMLFDLLAKKAVYGLDETEQRQLDELDAGTAETEFRSLEITAAAISMVGLETDEPLPAHLYSKIVANADKFVGSPNVKAESPWPPVTKREYESSEISEERPASSWFGWLGWTAAAAACILLTINLWFTQFKPVEQAQLTPPVETPKIITPAQMRDEFIRSNPKLVKANWAAGNVKEMKQITGDVVWSDEKQSGYMRFQGLPVNDATATCYQLWIFDSTQDKATPIDGGIFDVSTNGEIVIPINAKLKAQGPAMFAITIERHGGVVVSKREKIAALAKVETQTS